MGLFKALFGGSDKQPITQQSTEIAQTEYTQEEYEQYMMGFRLGYPLEGEPPATYPAENTPQFQRGLQEGRRWFGLLGPPTKFTTVRLLPIKSLVQKQGVQPLDVCAEGELDEADRELSRQEVSLFETWAIGERLSSMAPVSLEMGTKPLAFLPSTTIFQLSVSI